MIIFILENNKKVIFLKIIKKKNIILSLIKLTNNSMDKKRNNKKISFKLESIILIKKYNFLIFLTIIKKIMIY